MFDLCEFSTIFCYPYPDPDPLRETDPVLETSVSDPYHFDADPLPG